MERQDFETYQQVGAVACLRRVARDRAALRNALARRQRRLVFDMIDEEVERLLRVRLDQHELGERRDVRLDVIAVLHFVQPVLRVAVVVVAFA